MSTPDYVAFLLMGVMFSAIPTVFFMLILDEFTRMSDGKQCKYSILGFALPLYLTYACWMTLQYVGVIAVSVRWS